MGAGFNALAQAGAYNAENAAAHKNALDMAQRKFLADQYHDYAENIRLPDQQADPEGYKKALDMRSRALDAAQKVYTPDHHASLGEHLHGLIFGQQPDPNQPPQDPGATNPASTPAVMPGTQQPDMSHPFQHNPVYGAILEGLDGLGKHLKGFVQPNAPASPGPKMSDFAAVPTATELALKDAQTKADIAEKARLAEIKLTGENAAEVARIRSQFSQMSTPQKQFLNRWAVENGADNFQSLSSEDQAKALAEFKKTQVSQKPTFHTVGGNVQEFGPDGKLVRDLGPAKGLVITDHSSTAYDVNGNPVTVWNRSISKPGGQVVSEGTVSQQEHDALGTQQAQPKSSKAPSLDGINGGIAAANAGSKKLNKGKPVSSQAPQLPGAGQAHRATPFERSLVGQYTKVAEDANAKQASYDKAAQQARNPTPTSDQELIYAWVRSNVQGAGRMTQAEFKQAGGVGSVPMKLENWASLASSGKMTPQLRKFMLDDMKISADTSQRQANALRNQIPGQPVSSQAPQLAPSTSDDDFLMKFGKK